MMRVWHIGVSLRTRLTLWYGALLALTLLAFSGAPAGLKQAT